MHNHRETWAKDVADIFSRLVHRIDATSVRIHRCLGPWLALPLSSTDIADRSFSHAPVHGFDNVS